MRIVFGDCELDSGWRILLRHGRPTPLSAEAFQLLQLLVDRRPGHGTPLTRARALSALVVGSYGWLPSTKGEVTASLVDLGAASSDLQVPRTGFEVRPSSSSPMQWRERRPR